MSGGSRGRTFARRSPRRRRCRNSPGGLPMSTANRGPTIAPNQPVAASDLAAYEDTRGDGWVLFAGVILGMLAVLNLIDGIAAVSNSSFFAGNAKYVLSGLNTWGWVLICTAVVQGLTAFGVWARVTGVRWL